MWHWCGLRSPPPPSHLVLSQEGQVQDDLNGLSVGGHHDKLGDAAVKRLGRCAVQQQRVKALG